VIVESRRSSVLTEIDNLTSRLLSLGASKPATGRRFKTSQLVFNAIVTPSQASGQVRLQSVLVHGSLEGQRSPDLAGDSIAAFYA
jgi:hypothetical protein